MKTKFYIFGLLLACSLLFASLWQIEIVDCWAETFDFPFFIIKNVNKYIARDFWYMVNMLAFFLAVYCSLYIGKGVEISKGKKMPKEKLTQEEINWFLDIKKIQDILEEQWKNIKMFPNFINASVGTKIVNGKDTGQPCIRFYVSDKIKKELLKPLETIPEFIEDICTDVIEFKPDTWTIGETGMNEYTPEEQRRRASGVRRS